LSQRPRNRQPLGTGGIARLGSSFLAPVLSEFIDNGTPGFPADSFITVENRLTQPINVSPAFSDGSADYSSYYAVPPITRSTVPIDPQRGVLLGVSDDTFINDRTGVGTVTRRTFEKRTIPYRLHSDGAAPSEPLYPLERCMVASNDVILSGGGPSTNTAFVGSAWPGGATAQMATGPDGICIVGIALTIEAVSNMPSTGLLQVTAFPDPAGPEKFTYVPMGAALVAGQVIFIALPGVVAVTTSISGIATTSVTYTGMYWIGVPGL
jgi:hypothetical protein